MMYGLETRQLSKNVCDPNSGKCGRGRETTDIDRENTSIMAMKIWNRSFFTIASAMVILLVTVFGHMFDSGLFH